MNAHLKTWRSLEWTLATLNFIKVNFWVLFGLALIAAVGRSVQLRAFGPITPIGHAFLEIMIEGSRLAVVVYALGLANIKTGISKILLLIRGKTTRQRNWHMAMIKMRQQWPTIIINLGAFLLIAYIFNFLIDHIVYETCLYISLIARKLISDQSSEWVLILFFKNLSVIPFTLVFQTLFVHWITNRLPATKFAS
jgi:hypothetical protein